MAGTGLIFLRVLFIAFSVVFVTVGVLMLFIPNKYPNLYSGFFNSKVIRREATEQGKRMAIRTQGLIALACGLFLAFFVWALL